MGHEPEKSFDAVFESGAGVYGAGRAGDMHFRAAADCGPGCGDASGNGVSAISIFDFRLYFLCALFHCAVPDF